MGAMGLIGNAHRARGRSYGKIVWFCGVATRSRLSLRSCGVFVNQMTVQTLDNVPTPKNVGAPLGAMGFIGNAHRAQGRSYEVVG